MGERERDSVPQGNLTERQMLMLIAQWLEP